MAKRNEKYFYTFTYQIDNFSLREERPVVSQTFSTNRWSWILELLASRYSPDPFFSLFLVPTNKDLDTTLNQLTCLFELLDENMRTIIEREFRVSPYEYGLKIGTKSFVSPFKVFDVLARSKTDTIILRCRLVKCPFRLIRAIGWTARSEEEFESHSFKWMIEDLSCCWEMDKYIQIFETNVTITLEHTLSHFGVRFDLKERISRVILVCRVSFLFDHVEIYGIRHSKVFKNEVSWQFPKIERELLGIDDFTKGLFSVLFEISFWNGTYYVKKLFKSPPPKPEGKYVPNIKTIAFQ